MRLLLVEDDRGAAGFLRSGLEAEHYQPAVATDGQAALERGLSGHSARHRPALRLPGSTGPAAVPGWSKVGVGSCAAVLARSLLPRVFAAPVDADRLGWSGPGGRANTFLLVGPDVAASRSRFSRTGSTDAAGDQFSQK